MSKPYKPSKAKSAEVIEHPRLKRDRAIALRLARGHALREGKPVPEPSTIGPAVFTKLTPEMSREEKVENLIVALESRGIKVKRTEE
jgi:hypothetical protein